MEMIRKIKNYKSNGYYSEEAELKKISIDSEYYKLGLEYFVSKETERYLKDCIWKSEKNNNIKMKTNETLYSDIDFMLTKAINKGCLYDDYHRIMLQEEYPKETRDYIVDKYKDDSRWTKIAHKTSSEDGEMPGLTQFRFYFKQKESELK
jgi:hypothetical protein